ncbi:MAG TPA: S9 family peptidase [Pirellulales bacterium]|nr:S9 family peptidase [Pirellulales bacterium]
MSHAADNPLAAKVTAASRDAVSRTMPPPTPAGHATGLIPRQVLFGNPDKAAARMSHDGKWLSYLASVDGVLNIWVAPIDKLAEAKPVTKEKDRPIASYFWAYTNKHLLYSQDVKGDENFHIYAVDLESGNIKDLTPRGAKQEVRAEIEEVSYKFPHEILIGLNDRDPQYHDIYRMNIETGEKQLVQKNEEFAGFVTDEDYRIRFAEKFAPDGSALILKPDGKQGWTDFLTIPQADTLTTGVRGFDKSGDVLYFVDSRGRDTGAVTTLDLKTGQQRVIAENGRADAGGIMAHPTENTIQAISFDYDRTRWQFFDKAIEADFEYLKTVADGDITIVSRTLDDRQWIVAFLMDNGPVRYYHYDRPTKKERFLFTNRDDLTKWPLQKMHPVVIRSRDGLDLVSYLTLPPGADSQSSAAAAASGSPSPEPRVPTPVPLLIDVHGGPWARDSWGLNPNTQLWANRGYAVLSVNYRGSTGFGKKFANAGEKEWGRKMHDDILDAADWAVKQKIADPDKIAIMGGSYGGYETLVAMTMTPDRFACGVDIVGPSNLITLLKTIPPYWGPALQMFKDRVGDPGTAEGQKLLTERSPLTFADRIRRPLLIGQGAHDPRVKQSEADQIVHAMQAKKIPVTYVLFADEGHGFHRPENNTAFTAVTEAFLARHLGGRYESYGDSFKGSTIAVPTGADQVPALQEALAAHEKK